jgi:hypothetical protein
VKRLAMTALLAAGCHTSVTAPDVEGERQPVFVANYGFHSSLLLPGPRGIMTEWSWGDWDYFAKADTSLGGAARALLASRASTLGLRQFRCEGEPQLCRELGAKNVLRFEASTEDVRRLLVELSGRFEASREGLIYNEKYDQFFVPESKHYGLLYNCNHETADWLQQLRAGVSLVAPAGEFRLRSAP